MRTYVHITAVSAEQLTLRLCEFANLQYLGKEDSESYADWTLMDIKGTSICKSVTGIFDAFIDCEIEFDPHHLTRA